MVNAPPVSIDHSPRRPARCGGRCSSWPARPTCARSPPQRRRRLPGGRSPPAPRRGRPRRPRASRGAHPPPRRFPPGRRPRSSIWSGTAARSELSNALDRPRGALAASGGLVAQIDALFAERRGGALTSCRHRQRAAGHRHRQPRPCADTTGSAPPGIATGSPCPCAVIGSAPPGIATGSPCPCAVSGKPRALRRDREAGPLRGHRQPPDPPATGNPAPLRGHFHIPTPATFGNPAPSRGHRPAPNGTPPPGTPCPGAGHSAAPRLAQAVEKSPNPR